MKKVSKVLKDIDWFSISGVLLVILCFIAILRGSITISQSLTKLVSPAITVAERYTVSDKAKLLECITPSKLLIKYDNATYKLVLESPIDYIEGNELDITIKYTEMESGITYSTITGVGDFKVENCTKIVD